MNSAPGGSGGRCAPPRAEEALAVLAAEIYATGIQPNRPWFHIELREGIDPTEVRLVSRASGEPQTYTFNLEWSEQ